MIDPTSPQANPCNISPLLPPSQMNRNPNPNSLDIGHFPPLLPPSQTSLPNPTNTTPTTLPSMSTNPPPIAKPNSYLSLFKDNRQPSQEHTLDMEQEEELLCINEEDMLTIEEAWGHSLIGFLVGAVPSPRIVQGLVNGWKVPCKFSFHRNDWVVFEFDDEEAKKKVQEMGSHMSLGRSWIIRDVPKLFTFSDSCFASVPIWVNLRCLPKQLWSKKALSKIASQIGRPVCTDRITGDRSFHDCARILVEVDVTKEPKKVLPIKMPDGRVWDQPLDYEVQPVICSQCRSLGHSDTDCQGRRSGPPRRPVASGRGRSASKNPAPKVTQKDKGKEAMEDQTVIEKRATPTLPSASRVDRPVGVVIRDPTEIVQAPRPVTPPPTQRQAEVTTPQVVTPNPFAVLAGSDERSGSTRAMIEIEEEDTPIQIQALLDGFDEDDLLDEVGMDEPVTRRQSVTQTSTDLHRETVTQRGGRRRRRADAQ